jgi:hypothetical protein
VRGTPSSSNSSSCPGDAAGARGTSGTGPSEPGKWSNGDDSPEDGQI